MSGSDSSHLELIEAAYARLRETLEAKDVSADTLRAAALEALASARHKVELDPTWIATELERLRSEASKRAE